MHSILEDLPEFGEGQPRSLSPHCNAGLELVYLARGHLTWAIENRLYPLPPQSLFYTLPWEKHGGVTEYEAGCYLYYFVLALEPPDVQPPETARLPAVVQLPVEMRQRYVERVAMNTRRVLGTTPVMRELFPAFIKELREPTASTEAIRRACMNLILLEMERQITAASPGRSHEREGDLERFLSLLMESCEEPWTLETMCDRLGLRRTQFTDLIKTYTGDTPMGLLHRYRIEKARALLSSTTKPIIDIALECGYSSSQHFSRFFKRYSGLSPAQYRRKRAK